MPRKTSKKPVESIVEPQNLLEALSGEVVESPKTPKAKDGDTIVVHEKDLIEAIESWSASAVGEKIMESHVKQDKSNLVKVAFKKILQMWHNAGSKPGNPKFATSKASCCIQVKSIIKAIVPEGSSVEQELRDRGLSVEQSNHFASLVVKNITLTIPDLYAFEKEKAKKPNERNDEFIAAGEKLQKIMMEQFSKEERQLLLSKDITYKVDAEKLYACLAAKCRNAEQMEAVFEVLQPQIVPSHPQHQEALQEIKKQFDVALAVEATQTKRGKK